jgi:hypothetical protein
MHQKRIVRIEDVRRSLSSQAAWEGATVAVVLSPAGIREVGEAPPPGALIFTLGGLIVGEHLLLDHQVAWLSRVS